MSPLPPGTMSPDEVMDAMKLMHQDVTRPRYSRKLVSIPKGKMNAEGFIDGGKGRKYWPMTADVLNAGSFDLTGETVKAVRAGGTQRKYAIRAAWIGGAAACMVGTKMKSNPHEVDSAEWRAWGRGFRAWERDQNHRKP